MITRQQISNAKNTRQRILTAAEQIFATKGFQAMTLREVTQQAKVNLAAVNYHFGSKSGLVREVIGARIRPINAERLRQLDQLKAEYGQAPIPIELVFESLIRPLFQYSAESNFPQLAGRTMSDPSTFVRSMHKEFFMDLSIRYMQELQLSCPHLDTDTVKFRFFLAVSTMVGSIMDQIRLENLFDSKLDPAKLDRVVDELISFIAAGFKQ